MTNQSQIDTFVEQAKARLDEMGAATKEFEARLNTLDCQRRNNITPFAGVKMYHFGAAEDCP